MNTDCFLIFIFNRSGIFIKLSHLNVNYFFSICMSIYFNIIDIRKYVIKRLYITSVTQVHGLVSSNDYNS